MKVLVTGASERLGGALCAALAAAGHTVVGLDRVASPAAPIVADLLDAAALRGALVGGDCVVHTAALHAPQVGAVPDAEFTRVNVDGTRALLDAAAAAGVARFVFTSTTALYGAAAAAHDAALWVNEDTPPAPQTIYHRSNLAAEAPLREAAAAGGPTLTLLRIARCVAEPAPVVAVHRLHRAVDLRDVASAYVAAAAPGAPAGCWIVCVATPFVRADLQALWDDAASVLAQRAPLLVQVFAQRGWALPRRIDRVYDSARAQQALAWRPAHGWQAALASAVFDTVWNMKPRLGPPDVVTNPRDAKEHRCGLRLARRTNSSVFLSFTQHRTTAADPVRQAARAPRRWPPFVPAKRPPVAAPGAAACARSSIVPSPLRRKLHR